ncbi:MAG: DUF72 domain-containing protein [Hyphomicrobiales bacterium]
MTGRIRIGTSGWVYGHWRNVFYPQGLPQSRWFAFYARHFPTVEINATFYREPREAAVASWRDQAPPGFLYAVKAHRFMTHMKKLADCAEPVRRFFARAELLGDRLGPILFQIAPQVPVEPERLATFAALLPRDHTHVFEFRDARWFTPEVRDVLAGADLVFCIHDAPGLDCPDWVTAKSAYYRFHGPAGAPPYAGSYDDRALKRLARAIAATAAAGHDVYVYFNNDLHGHATTNARRLIEPTESQHTP